MHRHIIRWSAILSIVGVILLAILIGIARVLLPGVEHYRGEFETALTEVLGRPVSIGELRFQWHGWAPTLRVENITVRAPDRDGEDFHLASARLSVAPWDSLWRGAIQPERIGVTGVSLPIRRHADGQISVAGIPLQRDPDARDLPILAPRAVSVADSTITWQDDLLHAGGEALRFEHANALVSVRESAWHAQLDARLGDGRVDLRFDGGPTADGQHPSGELYARIDALPWPRHLDDLGLGDFSGRVDAELWTHLDRGAPRAMAAGGSRTPRAAATVCRICARWTPASAPNRAPTDGGRNCAICTSTPGSNRASRPTPISPGHPRPHGSNSASTSSTWNAGKPCCATVRCFRKRSPAGCVSTRRTARCRISGR